MSQKGTDNQGKSARLYGLVLGVVWLLGGILLPAPETIGDQGWRVMAVALLMLTWWISEAVPIPVTAMLPIVLFPLLDVMPIKQTTMTYGHPIVFLFMGGFVIALAMEKWHLHRRIALGILCKTGTHANGIIGGFMLATAFLSMWVSNTATTVMMLPIAMSVLELLLGDKRGKAATMGQRHFALALMLGIAYAANIGGTSTLIGTPPNAVFAGFIETRFGYQVDFMRWAMVGLPFAVLMLGICWWVLVHMMYPNQLGEIEGAGQMIDKEYQNLGAMSRGERSVLVVFVLTACCWMFKTFFPFAITDTAIAMMAAIILFMIPVNLKQGEFLLQWEDMVRLPWGILLLFGGGLTLASAMHQSGLVELIGREVVNISTYGIVITVLATSLVVLLMTECMSNVALISVFLPVLAGISTELVQHPLLFAIPATLAASCAFMLPMSTPPNAIVFASGFIRIPQMVKAGIVLNSISILMVTLVAFTLASWVFGLEVGVLPDWAQAD